MLPAEIDDSLDESDLGPWVEPTLANIAPAGSLAFDLEHAAAFPNLLSAGELVDAVVGFERLASWVAARQHELIAEFHRRPGDGTARGAATGKDPAAESPARREWAADEIGLALTLAPAAAANRVAQADRFATVLRPTRDLLQEGRLCPARAKLIASMLVEYDDEVATAVQARVLPKAPGQTLGQLRAAVNRAIIAVVPDPADRHQKARRERRVDLYPGQDGMATLSAYLTAAEAVASFNWITCLARGVQPHPAADPAEKGRGSMDRRRADVLVALLTGRLVAGAADTGSGTVVTTEPATDEADIAATDTDLTDDAVSGPLTAAPTPCGPVGTRAGRDGLRSTGSTSSDTEVDGTATPTGPDDGQRGTTADPAPRPVIASPVSAHRPLVHITMSITTLLGLDDEPGELAGYGPVPAPVAREIAADPDSTWRRLLTDPVSGRLLDYGRTTYRPPASLAGFVRARDGQCRYPGCRRPAVACELDHVREWQHGGSTSEDNLCALCERHHDLKEHHGWQVVLHDDRRAEWITPTGHRYWSHPVDHGTPPPAEPPPVSPPRRTLAEMLAFDEPDTGHAPPF